MVGISACQRELEVSKRVEFLRRRIPDDFSQKTIDGVQAAKSGRNRERDSYGNDPFPPKG